MSFSVGIHPPKTPITAGSGGVAKATLPNVCKMPGPPAPFIPSPLPNIAKSGNSPDGYSTSVKIEGEAVAIRGATFQSMGDEASKGTGGGLISANTQGIAKFIPPGTMDVKIEGKGVHLKGDQVLNNCASGGSPPNTGATMVGTSNPDAKVSGSSDCEEAGNEARRIADEQRDLPGAERPNKVSVIRTSDGTMISGVNGGGNNAAVQAQAETALANYAPNNVNNCQCAELNAISNAQNQGIDLTGSVITTVNVRGPNATGAAHGSKEPACSVCSHVLLELDIREC
jgi:hypothetical protein